MPGAVIIPIDESPAENVEALDATDRPGNGSPSASSPCGPTRRRRPARRRAAGRRARPARRGGGRCPAPPAPRGATSQGRADEAVARRTAAQEQQRRRRPLGFARKATSPGVGIASTAAPSPPAQARPPARSRMGAVTRRGRSRAASRATKRSGGRRPRFAGGSARAGRQPQRLDHSARRRDRWRDHRPALPSGRSASPRSRARSARSAAGGLRGRRRRRPSHRAPSRPRRGRRPRGRRRPGSAATSTCSPPTASACARAPSKLSFLDGEHERRALPRVERHGPLLPGPRYRARASSGLLDPEGSVVEQEAPFRPDAPAPIPPPIDDEDVLARLCEETRRRAAGSTRSDDDGVRSA